MAREILIADPNKAAHKAFEEIFKETDYHLIFSENGEDALLKMKLFNPVLVIADVTMPDKNGKELCQMLKGDPNLNTVPFVLLGGPFDENIEEEKNQVQADGTIIKPLKGDPILKLVDALLTGRPHDRTGEAEEEILELQSFEEVTEAVSSGGEEEIVDLLDVVEEFAAEPEEVSLEAPGGALERGETGEPEEEAFLLDKAVADLELPEDKGFPRAEEAIQPPEMELPGLESGPSEKVDFKEEAEVGNGISPQEEMAEFGGIEEQYPDPFEGTGEPERGEFGAEEVTGRTEAMDEVPQDTMSGEGLEDVLAEGIEGLTVEGISELGVGGLEPGGMTEELEGLPTEGTVEPGKGEFMSEEMMEEIPAEAMGDMPQDVLEGESLDEALAEEIEELPGDILGEGKGEDTPDEETGELEELEELGELGEETEELGEEEEVLEEVFKELPGEALEGEELEELPGVQLSTEELEGPTKEVSHEMDLEGLAEKVLREEDFRAFGEEGSDEEGLEGLQEEVFKEGELEKFAEEAMREERNKEIPGETLEEAIEAFTAETMRETEATGIQSTPERSVQDTVSGVIRELVEGLNAKILPQLTEAIAATVAERIDKTVQKIVPKMAEEAIQKEIRRLEKLKKGEDSDE